ncbi:enoyl-CoA hydratase/isomerase family protein [Nocardia kruczakiae]|uniref:enoyl-CoA hydratase/isomerase family protein n=1 Tax=Nocardia kruczakiae TaxID=261477 RepID=UPI0007A3804B|nr:enoyl-CoA hydratase/isomerase family protein [Nocardia kruczakiae]
MNFASLGVSSVPSLTRHGHVHVLDLGDGENAINPAWLDAVESHLDVVTAHDGPAALVTTASGKFWSNGLDLQWLMAHSEQIPAFSGRVQTLFARMLTMDVPTVAAVQGHAFGAAAMLALAHDQRVMREDRGYFCFPEIDIQIPFSDAMCDLITAKLTSATAHESMTTGRRYGGPEAVTAGLADVAVPQTQVFGEALARAEALAPKAGQTLGLIKARLYRHAVASLREAGAQ